MRVNLGFCPRCKDDFEAGRMTRTLGDVVFCYLCSFDAEEEGSVSEWVEFAKERQRNFGDGLVEAGKQTRGK